MTTINTATANNRSPKRVRLDDQPAIVAIDNTGKAKPTDAVKTYLRINAGSLPTSMQTLITECALEFVTLQSKKKQKDDMVSKFDDDAFTPSSTRFNFQLTSSESVMETQEFKTLATECTTHLKACQAQLKACMKKCIKN